MDVKTNTGGPPKYVMLSENGGDGGVRPPPYRRNIPRYHSTAQPYKKKGNYYLKCICCFYCFLFILIFGLSRFCFLCKSEFGSGLQEALLDNKKIGKIPLLIIVKPPIVIEMGSLPLKQVTFLVNYSLVIDSLTPRKQVKIILTTYHGAIE
ncbi:hypothetical protein MKW92_010998 [Papaver armeniacum]|nr:hypothetical protein MKW92_010998 [Papaver armeniacum]